MLRGDSFDGHKQPSAYGRAAWRGPLGPPAVADTTMRRGARLVLADDVELDPVVVSSGPAHVRNLLDWFNAVTAEGPRFEPVDPTGDVQIIELEVPDGR